MTAAMGMFQTTPPRRRRLTGMIMSRDIYEFQTTPPRRRRLTRPDILSSALGFKPRLRVGGDRDGE